MEPMEPVYDLIILGGGPAGLSAAIYMARAKYRTLVIEREEVGGQIAITETVLNYPGILQIGGSDFMQTMRRQAEQFGAVFLHAQATKLSLRGRIKTVQTTQGTVRSIGLLLATGASPRKAGFSGELEFRGRGVAYCATCDGELFTGKELFVVGGGYAAAEEALFLTRYASKVTVCIRSGAFSCAKSIADAVQKHPKIQVLFHTRILEAGGDTVLRYAVLQDTISGEETRYAPASGDTFGIFVFAGYEPETALFAGELAQTEEGYLLTDENQKCSLDGVYGAGDVCRKSLRQVVTAVSDGAIAAAALEQYVEKQRQLYPEELAQQNLKEESAASPDPSGFSTELQTQLASALEGIQVPFCLRVHTEESELARQLLAFVRDFCKASPVLRWEQVSCDSDPVLSLCDAEGQPLGWRFHGIPSGHETSSLVSILRFAAGLGQPVSPQLQTKIRALTGGRLVIAVTLSCTMCPETVLAAAQLALLHPEMQTDVYDISRFPKLREAYQIMSVPCIIWREKVVGFGKKNLEALVELLDS